MRILQSFYLRYIRYLFERICIYRCMNKRMIRSSPHLLSITIGYNTVTR